MTETIPPDQSDRPEIGEDSQITPISPDERDGDGDPERGLEAPGGVDAPGGGDPALG